MIPGLLIPEAKLDHYRLAGALELKLLIGFESEAGDRELVSV
jgi:hypothetical protein